MTACGRAPSRPPAPAAPIPAAARAPTSKAIPPPGPPDRAPRSYRGRWSVFGGPDDFTDVRLGLPTARDLALITPGNCGRYAKYFRSQPPNAKDLFHDLDPRTMYVACRWDYRSLGDREQILKEKARLVESLVTVRNLRTGARVLAKPVDWGPAESTGKAVDLSPGARDGLRLKEADEVEVVVPP